MRKDIKIGVVAGLVFVIAFVTWHVVFQSDPADPNATGDGELASAGGGGPGGSPEPSGPPGGEGLVRFGGPGSPGGGEPAGGDPPLPVVPPTPEVPPVPAAPVLPVAPPVPVTPPVMEVSPAPVTPPVGGDPPVPETPGGPSIVDVPPVPETPLGPPLPTIRPRPAPGVLPPPEPAVPAVPEIPSAPAGGTGVGATREQIYVVKENDAGFWGIAEKLYGDGRLWTLIAKANPDADSNRLPPGKKLKIPPRPAPTIEAPAGPASPASGGLITTAGGTKTYVVRKNDAGFWGIAQTVYGNGKYWTLIAKANPGVNSNTLQPGDRLNILPKPTSASTPETPAAPPVVAGPGETVYTVEKADSAGFWGIAKKLYGNGLYWPAIAKANPSANSGSLHAGQKLRIPKLTDEMRREMGRTATTRSTTPAPRRDGVEDIGPRPSF